MREKNYTIDIIHKQGKYNIVGIIDAQEKLNTEKFGILVGSSKIKISGL